MLAPELVPRFCHYALSNGVANTLLLLPPVATGACVTPAQALFASQRLKVESQPSIGAPSNSI